MKKRLVDYLPRPLHIFLGRVRAFLIGIFFPIPCAVFAHMQVQDNKIIFDNYQGKGFGCNPKCVAQELIDRGCADKYDLVWLVSRHDTKQSELPAMIRTVRYGSLKSLFEYYTAKVWVSNYHKIYFIRCGLHKRENQFFIQMWHGSLGIKKIDGDVAALTQDRLWLRAAMKSSRMTDYWISNSSFETDVYKRAFWDVKDESVLLYGHPRNDIFFDAEKMQAARQKVSAAYDTGERKILLYAPTFREDYRTDCYGIDFSVLAEHMKRRFGGEWMILVRLHPRIRDMYDEIIPSGACVADATNYTDIQELLAAADCLITDYSSCAFDFMLTRRPVFLFATDVKEYDMERGFYYPLEETPFPLSFNNAELMKNINAFDEAAYLPMVEAFLKGKGCMEDGNASKRVADLIERLARPSESCNC